MIHRLSCLLTLPLLLLGDLPEAAEIHVPGDHSRITAALGAASPGDSVLVGPGTYSAATNLEAFPLSLSQDVRLLGAGADRCTLDAGGIQSTILVTAAAGGRVSGFTITGGSSFNGGGVRITAGTAEIDHNVIRENVAQSQGSGIYIGGGAPWIHHNVVWENADRDTIDPGDPHGIQTAGGSGTIEHNLVGRGDSNGLLVGGGDEPVIRNNIFFENGIPGVRGRGICHFGGPGTVIAYNLFHGNAIAALLVNPGGGAVDLTPAEANDLSSEDGITGNLSGDPMFVSAEGGAWNLIAGSPAIDAGDPSSPLDPDGTRADVGPFFFDQSPSGIPDPGAGRVRLAGLPNPFRSRTTVSFTLSTAERARIEVFDLEGRRIAVLLDARREAGAHTLDWSPSPGLPAGVYFLRMRAGAVSAVRRLTVLP